jgi:hypothetical protein
MDKAAAETPSLTASVARAVDLLEASALCVLSTTDLRGELKLFPARRKNAAAIGRDFQKKA